MVHKCLGECILQQTMLIIILLHNSRLITSSGLTTSSIVLDTTIMFFKDLAILANSFVPEKFMLGPTEKVVLPYLTSWLTFDEGEMHSLYVVG